MVEETEITQGIYYMKKCRMVLRSAENLAALLPLSHRLTEIGVLCEALLSEELLSEPQESEDSSPEGVLYLTDDPLVYIHLKAPVLIYLHPGNRGEDFADARYALEEPEETETEYLERVYRRCCELPWEILTTKRCWLRETIEADVDNFWNMYQAPGITRYTEQLFPSLEAERGYVREYRRRIYSFYEFGVWTVLDRSSGEVVGRAGLSVREGYELPELGFVIAENWQGRGLATEVCRGILEYARDLLGFERIQVLVHEDNAASLHLCRKLGFREQPVPSDAGSRISASAPETAGAGGHADIFGDCLVEMKQNGQNARFVYMVYGS